MANVIPRRAKAHFAIAPKDEATLQEAIRALPALVAPYVAGEPKARILCNQVFDTAEQGFSPKFQSAFLNGINRLTSGVHSMSADVPDLVETSNNLSIVVAARGKFHVTCLARSCVEAHKSAVIKQVSDCFAATGGQIWTANDAPGWEPRADSALLQIMSDAFEELQNTKPGVIAIHAGLETGIISGTFPQTQMVSYGPNIQGAHSTDERVQISSVQKVWAILQKTLASIPTPQGPKP